MYASAAGESGQGSTDPANGGEGTEAGASVRPPIERRANGGLHSPG